MAKMNQANLPNFPQPINPSIYNNHNPKMGNSYDGYDSKVVSSLVNTMLSSGIVSDLAMMPNIGGIQDKRKGRKRDRKSDRKDRNY